MYLKKKEYETARAYFQKEIENDGKISSAYWHLIKTYYQEKDADQLQRLYQDETTRTYFPFYVERYVLIKSGKYFEYFMSVFRQHSNIFNPAGFIASLFVLIVWFFFLKRLDIFEPEKTTYLLITLFLGMFFSYFTCFWHDLLRFGFGLSYNTSLTGDLVYFIFGVGFIEELVKIIPLLLMIKFSREVNESVDYLNYASVSALGFAFIENNMYFQELELTSIHGRAFTAVVMHMFLSSLVAYGLVLSKYKTNKNPYGSFAAAFAAAAVIHGLYDFNIASDFWKSGFSGLISLGIFVYGIVVLNKLYNNSLNQSEYFSDESVVKINSLSAYLLAGLTAIILVEYVIIGYKAGPSNANTSVLRAFHGGIYFLFILPLCLGRFNLTEKVWLPMFYFKPRYLSSVQADSGISDGQKFLLPALKRHEDIYMIVFIAVAGFTGIILPPAFHVQSAWLISLLSALLSFLLIRYFVSQWKSGYDYIQVDDEKIFYITRSGIEVSLKWDDISECKESKFDRRSLVLCDSSGKKAINISCSTGDFWRLLQLIIEKIPINPDYHTTRLQTSRSNRIAGMLMIVLFAGGILFAFVRSDFSFTKELVAVAIICAGFSILIFASVCKEILRVDITGQGLKLYRLAHTKEIRFKDIHRISVDMALYGGRQGLVVMIHLKSGELAEELYWIKEGVLTAYQSISLAFEKFQKENAEATR